MNLDTIRVFAVSKLGWIRQQQKKVTEQERESPREYLDRESHYVWGKRYLLKLIEKDAAPEVELKHSQMVLQVRPAAGEDLARKPREAHGPVHAQVAGSSQRPESPSPPS